MIENANPKNMPNFTDNKRSKERIGKGENPIPGFMSFRKRPKYMNNIFWFQTKGASWVNHTQIHKSLMKQAPGKKNSTYILNT